MTTITRPAKDKDKVDGRRLRGSRSRDKIKATLLDLIRDGNYVPRAHDISDRSGISLRTVFRHIEDMDSIAREVNADIERQVLPILMRPYQATDWRAQVMELTDKRIEIYELIMPLRVHMTMRRFRSDFLNEEYNRLFDVERAGIEAVLPMQVAADGVTLEALNAIISCSSWITLRLDHQHALQDAERILRHQVTCLIGASEG